MEEKKTEIRTPNRQLLLGVAQVTDGKLMLEVHQRGKSDTVEVQSLIHLLSAL